MRVRLARVGPTLIGGNEMSRFERREMGWVSD